MAEPVVGILVGSESDRERMQAALDELERLVQAEGGREGAHATGVWPRVAVAGTLVILGGSERDRAAAVAEGEQRDLGALE